MTDKVLAAYEELSLAVCDVIGCNQVVWCIADPLHELAALYGIDTFKYIEELALRNDVQAVADSMRGDPLVRVRIIGTLVQNLADIAGCVYDVEASLQMSEVIGQMLGTILIIQELDNA